MFGLLNRLAGNKENAPMPDAGAADVPQVVETGQPSTTVEPAVEPESASEVNEPSVLLFADPGHFYSPIVDPETLHDKADQLWQQNKPIAGIDFSDANHVRILVEVFPAYIPAYQYPDELPETPELTEFFSKNSQFGWLDSRVLFVLLQYLQPRRIVEIGCGFSSLLTADVNNRLLQNRAKFSCIEPYPREFLRKQLPGLDELLVQKVEEVPIDYFAELSAGDVLLIDSSHVAKTGSDVNYLVFEILPRLQPGVIVHIHDVFLPAEYPKHWVFDDNRSWNEQYVIQALLMYSTAFRVYFGCNYAFVRYPDLVATALGRPAIGGSSLWLERI